MPKFKEGGTGYEEMPRGSEQFPEQRESPEGSSDDPATPGREHLRDNPDEKSGPQVY